MNQKKTLRLFTGKFVFMIGIFLPLASLQAATWTNYISSPFYWGTAANWSPQVFPNANGAIADFQTDVPADTTISVVANNGTGNLTPLLTTLKIGDTNGAQALTFNKGAASTSRLHFTNSTGSILIEKRGDGNDVIEVGAIRPYNNNFNITFTGGIGTLTLNTDISQQAPFVTRLNVTGGTLLLTGSAANTHSGGMVISAATIQFANENRLGAVPLSVDPANVTIGNNSTLRANGNPILNVNRGLLLKGGGTVNFATVTALQTLTVNGPISSDVVGPSSVVASGPGIVALLGANTYAGPTVVTGGTLSLVGANYSGGGALSVSNGSVLTLNATSNGKLNVSNATLGNGGDVALNLNYGEVSGVNPVSAALDVAGVFNPGAATVIVSVRGTNLVAGQFPLIDYTGSPLPNINNFSIGSLPPGVIGTLVHNSANTSIDLNISLVVNALTWFGGVNDQWDIAGALNWNSGATNYNEIAGVGDTALFDDTLDGTALRTNINLTTTLQPALVSVANNSVEYIFSGAGNLNGPMALNKSGSQALTIQTANGFSGGSTLSLGTVRVGNNAALGTGRITFAGGGLSSDSGTARTLANGVRFTSANGVFATLGDSINTGKLTISGAADFSNAARDLMIHSDVAFSGTVTNGGLDQKQGEGLLSFENAVGEMANGQFQLEQGSISISGGNITKTGGGIRIVCLLPGGLSRFSISNGAVVTVVVSGGNLRIGSPADPISEISATNIVDVSATLTWTSTSTGVIQMGGSCAFAQLNLNAGGLLRPNSFLHQGNITEVNFNGGTLAPLKSHAAFLGGLTAANVRSGGAIIDTEGNDIVISQALLDGSGGGGLAKNGLGKLTLTGANTYTGNTLVNAGTLVIGNAHAGPGNILVANGATAGFLSTGAGLLGVIPSVSIAAGGSLQAEFSGQFGNPTTPAATVSGLTLNGVVPVNVVASGITAGTIPLIAYTTLSGGGSVTTGQLPQGVNGTITNNTTTKTIELIISSVDSLLWTGANGSAWDVNTTPNWTVLGTPSVFQQGSAVRLDDSASSTLVVIQEPVTPSSLVVSNTVLSYTLTAGASGKLSGATGWTKRGTNILTMGGTHDFSGEVNITEGKAIILSTGALGSTNGTTIVQSGGTLDTSGLDLRSERFTVSGSGVNGQGALVSSVQNQNILRYVTLTGDTTVGNVSGIQWGFQGPTPQVEPYFVGNGFKLTKVTSGDILLKDLGETSIGDIEIIEGALSFQLSSSMGDPLKTCTVQSGGFLAFRDQTVSVNKILVVNGGTVRNTEPTIPSTFSGPTTLNGSCQFSITPVHNMLGVIGGSGNLLKTGNGTLNLAANNTYSGSTLISNGIVQLAATGSLASSNIFVNTSARFDVSLVSGFTLASGQTISGNGSVNGSVIANGTISPGSSIGALTFSNDLSLAGNTIMEISADGGLSRDVVNVTGALTYGGTLQVVLAGSTPLAVNDTFDLFSWGSRLGSFANLTLPTGYTWDASQLEVDGTIRVAAVSGGLTFGSTVLSGNNLILSGSGGTPNGTYHVLSSTNIAQPFNTWTPLATNLFDGSGNFSFTNAIDSTKPTMFFGLQVP